MENQPYITKIQVKKNKPDTVDHTFSGGTSSGGDSSSY